MAPKLPLTERTGNQRVQRLRRPARRDPGSDFAPQWPEGRAGLVIERSTDAFVSSDEQGVIVAWNPAAEQLFGWSSEEAIGRTLSETIVPARLRADHERDLARFLAGGRGEFLGRSVELPARRRDDSERTVEMSVSALRTDAGWAFDAWIRDITARRRTEIQTERARLEFFATVAHELATPVTSVLGQLDAIGDDERRLLGDDARQSLETLEREVARIARLAADLRVAAQTSSGELRIEKGQVRLGEVVAGSVDAARPRAEAKSIDLLAMIERDPFYRGDADRLGQVVHNLISNALKFTPDGGRVVVKLVCGAGEFQIRVSDTGPGIEEGERANVFERSVGSGPGAGGGMGIGLAVTRAIVEAHGGSIEVVDDREPGATFVVHLPTGESGRGSGGAGRHEARRSRL